MSFVSVKADFAFKELFGIEDVRKQFISDTTEIPLERIQSVRIVNPFLRKRFAWQKQGILDIALELDDGTKIDIEMQLRPQKDWTKRNLFYLTRLYADNLWVGQRYERLRKCITISILDFNQIPGGKNHSVFTLKDADGKEWTDLFEIHIIELRKQLTGDNALNDWIRLFNATCEEDLDMIKSKSRGMSEAVEAVRRMGLVRDLRWIFEQHQKAVRDRWAEDDYVRDEGRAEGRAESVLQLLSSHGDVPEKVKERIYAERDTEVLKQMLRDAAGAGGTQEFEDKWCK
ncbi:MAG: Rpn family recombination-promoting nuclease/putative transposase [Lachnospiraceae bacterium]|nr:Rpn family recombination-promoting nuclease/putative transposase [Lachnospiraceae bacterium]